MENDSKINKFVSKLTYLLNVDENGSETTEEKFFGKYDIAVLTLIGILLITLVISFALRFVVQPAYWYLVDIFSVIVSASLVYFIIIRKVILKK